MLNRGSDPRHLSKVYTRYHLCRSANMAIHRYKGGINGILQDIIFDMETSNAQRTPCIVDYDMVSCNKIQLWSSHT